ncbi:acyltransferase family protein [Kitasatospora sp. LaBMicrA B282]|uniref:acyltransferase family protein n=1 Tax=Kitasatospora sp. LaBMicrA B282 TaxID=3420949 RepID=UPI003D0B0395
MATDQLAPSLPIREAAQAPAPATPKRSLTSRLPSLTGLRFPAALLVFAYHSALPIPSLRFLADNGAEFDYAKIAGQAGGLGVSFFFVLSGFVLTWSARKKDTARAFWRRRLVKIYPNYAIAWALAMVLFAASYTPVRTALANLFMLQVWVPDFNVNFSVDPPSWSLGAEAIFYAAFPLLHLVFQRIRPQNLKYWITGAVAGVVAAPALAYALLPSGPGIPGGELSSVSQYWFTYVLPPVRIFDFALGMLVAHAVRNGRWKNIGMIWSSVLLVAGYVLTNYVPYLYGQRAACIIPVVLLIAATAIADAEDRFTIFRNRAMTWLGEISFAFYLLHFVVLATTRKLLGTHMFSTPAGIALLVAEVGISILVAWALYVLVERPITKRFSKPRKRSELPTG